MKLHHCVLLQCVTIGNLVVCARLDVLYRSTQVCCSVLQRVAACCSVLQYVAVCYTALCRSGSQVCCGVLQCVAVCCSVLQCVAVCCSVLRCVAVCYSGNLDVRALLLCTM